MHLIALRDGAKLQVDVAGSGGTALVLISGLGGTSRFWEPLVNALRAAAGPALRTISFDQRGIASSERGSVSVSIRSLAEDTWEIIDALGVERPVLCGHSTGGAIVQVMALMRSGASAGIVLSGSWAGPDVIMEHMFKIRLDLLARLPERYAEQAALLGSPPRWLRDHPHVLEQATAQSPNEREVAIIRERIEALLAHDCRDRLADMAGPALVLGAEDDMIVPVYLQEELATLIGGARLELFETGGHFFPTTRASDMANLLLQWMSNVAPPQQSGTNMA